MRPLPVEASDAATPRPLLHQAIAVVGMSGRFPGVRSLDDFWRNLREGVVSLETFTDAELEAAGVTEAMRSRPDWVRRGTVLEGSDLFDAAFFGYSPREAQIIDPQHRVFLECAWEALEHAGYAAEPPGTTIGVYAGASLNTYVLSQILADRALVESVGGYQLMLGNDKDFLCTRVSYKFDLHGPSMTIQTACSTSLVAVEVACRALQRGECDMAMAGGVSIVFPERTGYRYQEGMIFSPDGTCRPFDVEARGTRAGAGAGVVVLKRLADALADRDTVHAVILGAAINNDGAGKVGYTAPSVDGQVEVIATAQALAGIDPRTIAYVEAHGTATPLGDPIEIAALTKVFRASTEQRGFCAIGSLKANLGHLDAAAGVAGLIKTILALQHREIPPLPHFTAPNPQLALPASPFRIATSVEPWTSAESPRRAAVSSFGIGGTNAHVVLEEAPPPASSLTHRSHSLLVFSARTPEALAAGTANFVEFLRANPATSISDAAHTLQIGRKVFQHRRSLAVHGTADAIEHLSRPERPPVVTDMHDGAPRPVAFLFSGQGSQHAGMCRELYFEEPTFREAVDRCATHLRPLLGCDLRDLLREGTDDAMSETRLAQPLLFVAEYALATLWMSWGVQPSAMLGHSIGEYVAAHLAGVFSLEDALTLVAARGRLMQEVPPGDMIAVSLSVDELKARLVPGCEIAAVNAPTLCSVSGDRAAIARLTGELEQLGIEHRRLHTSHAFHSAMMEPALAPFRDVVARTAKAPPSRRYVSNLTGTWIRPDQAVSPDYYVEHLRRAVLFADGIVTLASDPSLLLLEVGPGTALSSLARATIGNDGAARVISSLPHPRESRAQIAAMLAALGRLWTAGAAVSWEGLHRDERLRRVPLPAYPFERKRCWVDAPKRADQAAAPVITRLEDVKDWLHVPTWMRAPLADSTQPIDGLWLLVGGDDALTVETASRLRARGGVVVVVREGPAFAASDDGYLVRPAADEDYETLFRDLRKRGVSARGVVHLWNVGRPSAEGQDAAGRPLHSIMALSRALIREGPSSDLRVIIGTSGAQSVLNEAIGVPSRALVNGPVLALPAELETARVTAVDVSSSDSGVSPDETADVIVHEASAGEADSFVAWRGGLRWVRRYAASPVEAVEPRRLPLKDRGVYLVTGGTGGIGLTVAEWLATRVKARLLLTSRTALPDRSEWDCWLAEHDGSDSIASAIVHVRRIEAAGSEVLLMTADAANEGAMRQAVNAARERWGEFDGVVHSAGVAGGAAIAFSDVAETDGVVRAKVAGTRVLARLFESTPLDFFVGFSSISAVIGAPGTCAYAAGCAYIDAFVLSSARPRAWRMAQSVAWDAWRDVGMAPRVVVPESMRAARRAYVAAGISPADGAEAFARTLGAGLPQYVVSPYEVDAILGGLRRKQTRRRAVDTRPAAPAAAPRVSSAAVSTVADPPVGAVEEAVASIWLELLGVGTVGAGDNFFELGGHSLLATRLLARIDDSLGVRLPLRAIFDAPTIRQLAGLIGAQGGRNDLALETTPSEEREEFEL